jgi:hypothetical protein
MQDPSGNLLREGVVFVEDDDRTPAEDFCPPDMVVAFECRIMTTEGSNGDDTLESLVAMESLYRKQG